MTGIQNKVDILLISETKPDKTFPTRQFSIEGFTSPYCLDRNGSRGGLLAHAREDITSKLIKTELSNRGVPYRDKLKKQKMDYWMFLQLSKCRDQFT